MAKSKDKKSDLNLNDHHNLCRALGSESGDKIFAMLGGDIDKLRAERNTPSEPSEE